MKILQVIQGDAEWLSARAQYCCASDAPIMMGQSTHITRSDMIRMRATGDRKEVSDWVQKNLFDAGHQIEAEARYIAEQIVGEELFPVTGVTDDDALLASFDGLTLLEDVAWEIKSWNEEKAKIVRSGMVPQEDFWQCVQQLVVSGADRLLYMVSNGTPERTVYVWMTLDACDENDLWTGWKQYADDIAAFEHVEIAKPIAAEPVMQLPAVFVQVSGTIVISDNFPIFEEHLRDFIDNQLIRSPQTDQDFADLAEQIKSLKNAEAMLDAAEADMFSKIAEIDRRKRLKDMLYKLARDNRLMAEKLMESEKQNRRGEILRSGQIALAEHVKKLNTRLGSLDAMPPIAGDFAGVMKGKRTISSLRDAVDTELARCKIAATETADLIDTNLKILRELAGDHKALFADTKQIVLKQTDDLTALIKVRISDYKAEQDKKLEAERARIRAEEQAKVEAAQRRKEAEEQAKAKAEQEARDATQREADAKVKAEREKAEREAQAKHAAELQTERARAEWFEQENERLSGASTKPPPAPTPLANISASRTQSDTEIMLNFANQLLLIAPPKVTDPANQEVLVLVMREIGEAATNIRRWVEAKYGCSA